MNCFLPIVTGLAIGADACLATGLLEDELDLEQCELNRPGAVPVPYGLISANFVISVLSQAANLALIHNLIADFNALTIWAALFIADQLAHYLAACCGKLEGLALLQRCTKRLLIASSWVLAGYLSVVAPLFGVGIALQLAIKALQHKLPSAVPTWSARLARMAGAVVSWNVLDLLGKAVTVTDVICTSGLVWHLPLPATNARYSNRLQQIAATKPSAPTAVQDAPSLEALHAQWRQKFHRPDSLNTDCVNHTECSIDGQDGGMESLFERLHLLEQRIQEGAWGYIYDVDTDIKNLWQGIKAWSRPHEVDEIAKEYQLCALKELAANSNSDTAGTYHALSKCYALLSSQASWDVALINLFRLLRTKQLFEQPTIAGWLNPLGSREVKSVSAAQDIAIKTPSLDSCFLGPAHLRLQPPLYGIVWMANAAAYDVLYPDMIKPELLREAVRMFLQSPLGRHLWAANRRFAIEDDASLRRALMLLEYVPA